MAGLERSGRHGSPRWLLAGGASERPGSSFATLWLPTPRRLRCCYNDGDPQDLGGEQVMSRQTKTNEILTLAEAARYLRLSQEAVKKQAQRGHIPGRQVGKHWRFLKAALEDWLRRPSSKSVLLEMAGAFKDDPHLDEIVKNAYAERRRTTMK